MLLRLRFQINCAQDIFTCLHLIRRWWSFHAPAIYYYTHRNKIVNLILNLWRADALLIKNCLFLSSLFHFRSIKSDFRWQQTTSTRINVTCQRMVLLLIMFNIFVVNHLFITLLFKFDKRCWCKCVIVSSIHKNKNKTPYNIFLKRALLFH